jgi:hypothetical protein
MPIMKIIVFAGICLLGGASVARATLVVPRTLEQLTKGASVVVHGRVVQMDVDSESGHRTAVVEALEVAKGSSEEKHRRDFRVPLLNRAIPRADLVEQISMAPELRLGEEVVLYLVPRAVTASGPHPGNEETFTLNGFQQGKLRVLNDARGVRRVLQWDEAPREPVLSPLELARQRTTPRLQLMRAGTASPQALPPVDDHLPTLDAVLNLARGSAQ